MFMELKDGETIKKHQRRSREMKGRPTEPHFTRSTERGAASTFQVSQMDRRSAGSGRGGQLAVGGLSRPVETATVICGLSGSTRAKAAPLEYREAFHCDTSHWQSQ